MRKQGGWEAFEKKTNELAEKLVEMTANKENTIEEVMEKVTKLENKAKFAVSKKKIYSEKSETNE